MKENNWQKAETIEAISYICPGCDKDVASNQGWRDKRGNCRIYICPKCQLPVPFQNGRPLYRAAFGPPVKHANESVGRLYHEARLCIMASAPTAAAMVCRKLLMVVAVEMGMPEKDAKSYVACVKWMFDNHHLPKNWGKWVAYIRTKGNEANHEIPNISNKDAEQLITFVGLLLQSYYDAPASLPPSVSDPKSDNAP